MSRFPRFRRAGVTFAALLFAAALVSCSSGGGGGSSASGPPPVSSPPSASVPTATGPALITIADFAFAPADLLLAPGTTVTVVNQDSVTHTVTSDAAGVFDTGDIPAGGTSTFTTPSVAGTNGYHCAVHPYMTGSLTTG